MANAIEYGLIAALAGVAIVVGVSMVGQGIENGYQGPPAMITTPPSSQLAVEVNSPRTLQLEVGQTADITCGGGLIDASVGGNGTTITASCESVRARPLPPRSAD